MEHFLLGPALLAVGLGFIHFSVKGMPEHLPWRRKPVAVEFGAEDRLLGEVLCEMLTLHEELDAVRSQLALARQPKRSPRKAAVQRAG